LPARVNFSKANYFLENALNGIEQNGKETWIKTLPQVLFLNLNRFEYNRDLQMPQKSNERLEFKEEIFMDRYLSQNQDRFLII
jgi:uncharacterized UBP type Zn finger protein